MKGTARNFLSSINLLHCFFFFFQAEDGIRDVAVTGVQTCALPIFPIGLHLLAASKETPQIEVPRLLFGLPLERGQRLLAGAMVANASRVGYHGVRVRLLLRYVPAGRPWPLYRTYPWAIDVEYPLGRPPTGSKAFDLPPGRTVRFWEGSPAIAGTILGLGGHLHDYGLSLELADVSAGRVLWHGEPISDGPRGLAFPLTRVYNLHQLGLHIVPTHRYRLTP